MIIQCPSSKIQTKDSTYPEEGYSTPICSFCSQSRTQKEILDWQVSNLEQIPPEFFPVVFRHFYRYLCSQLKDISSGEYGRDNRKNSD